MELTSTKNNTKYDIIYDNNVEKRELSFNGRTLKYYVPSNENITNVQVVHNLLRDCHKAISFTTPSALYVYVEQLKFRNSSISKVNKHKIENYITALTIRRGFLKTDNVECSAGTDEYVKQLLCLAKATQLLTPANDNLGQYLLLGGRDRDRFHNKPILIHYKLPNSNYPFEQDLTSAIAGEAVLMEIKNILETEYLTEDWKTIEIGVPAILQTLERNPFSNPPLPIENEKSTYPYHNKTFSYHWDNIDDFIFKYRIFYNLLKAS